MRQRGQVLILVLLLLSVAAGAVLFSFFNSTKITLDSDQKTADALAAAKAALIGYALIGGDCVPQPTCAPQNPQRPGEFPCPDTNNDGNADGTCVAGRLGRIPWKTLGIPEPKDGAGETLWYAVADLFRSYNSGSLNNHPINSDTRGTIADPSLTVYAADGTTTLTTQAVAVIFAPGQALGAQSRNAATTAACATTGTTIAQNLCAANYLETSAGINNAATNGPFIVGRFRDPANANYNDRVLFITTPQFMSSVEMRVAKELKTRLDGYRANSACQCYPWADSFVSADGTSDNGVNRGRFPLIALPENWSPSPPAPPPPPGSIPALPSWFGANNWHNVIYYSVAKQNTAGGGANCTTCLDTTLNVINGASGVSALFFTPGTPPAGINRPTNVLADYLRDAQNNDGTNDVYITPSSVALDRNRIMTLTSAASPNQCAQNAAALLALTPCGHLNPQCITFAGNLATCSCASAANQIYRPPCENNLNPSQCQSAVAILNACNS